MKPDHVERLASYWAEVLGGPDDAGLPGGIALRAVLHDYMSWAVSEVMSSSPRGAVVPENLAVPHWSWDGLVSEPAG